MSLPLLSFTQSTDELSYAEQLEALELELDSLSIFNLLDSVLLLGSSPKSELNIRYGFTSSVTSGGRDYNINQTGYSGGLSYFHKSGTYVDVSGYWNSNVNPGYNPTILSTGYLGSFSKKWNFSFDYEHWFYNPQDSSENELTNSLGTSLSYDFKIGYASIDYSYLFGKKTSNRLIGSLAGTINLGKWWMFKSVSVFPTFNIMAGNGNVTTLRITNQQISEENQLRIGRIDSLSMLTDNQRAYLAFLVNKAYENGDISLRRRNMILNDLRLASSLSQEELDGLVQIAENGIDNEEFTDGSAFGILNYSFTIPLSLSTNRISILLSYTYSIPVKLPGEFFEVDPIGYFGASILYRIPFN
ncbi:MAG: hypothetical protein RIM99_08930 [Cyclobacteriaceae bacterium]